MSPDLATVDLRDVPIVPHCCVLPGEDISSNSLGYAFGAYPNAVLLHT